MADRIRWINHAGFELQTEGLRIVCDPWLSGFAFNQSWALLSETKFTPSDFEGVDYIWFSHEHPDHFAPGDLRKIPENIRATITVLFQKTRDGRVASFCRKLGFKGVREIDDWERTHLGNGVFISIKKAEEGADSLCFIETPSRKYLNINDCVASDIRAFHESIFSKVGQPDVLLTQFSYANWVGNPGDDKEMALHAADKIKAMDIQLEIYRPKILIPFASFVWFCRSDNFHLNAHANRIGNVFGRFKSKAECVVLYPGDIYEVCTPHDSGEAISKYNADETSHSAPLEMQDEPVSCETIDQLSSAHQKRIKSNNSIWLFKPLEWLGMLKPVKIYLTDTHKSLSYSMFGGVRWTSDDRSTADIEFSSVAMAQLLRFGTGYDTLYISGRFIERTPGSQLTLSRHFVVLRRNENGQFFPSTFLNMQFITSKLGL